MFSLLVVYFMIIFFFILLFFGEREYRSCSLVIFTSCVLNIMTDSPYPFGASDIEIESMFIKDTKISVLWDSLCIFLLITSKLFSQNSGKQALLLAFAVFCHIMVAYDIINFFRTWYVELIIFVGILQMMVVKNGFISALIRSWKFVRGISSYICRLGEGVLERKKAE